MWSKNAKCKKKTSRHQSSYITLLLTFGCLVIFLKFPLVIKTAACAGHLHYHVRLSNSICIEVLPNLNYCHWCTEGCSWKWFAILLVPVCHPYSKIIITLINSIFHIVNFRLQLMLHCMYFYKQLCKNTPPRVNLRLFGAVQIVTLVTSIGSWLSHYRGTGTLVILIRLVFFF